MAEWEINPESYLERLNLNINEFESQLHLPNIRSVEKIIPLREIKSVGSMIPVSSQLLSYLLRRVKTLDGRFPFAAATFKMVKTDPHDLKIGQKFVYRENYQHILEEVPNMFRDFLITTGGLSELGAYFIFGRDANDSRVLACYVPPIIEKHRFGDVIIMDGIHRSYIGKQAGLALYAIMAENVALPFPCSPKEWSEIQVISLADKPKDINERYFDLNKGLFRDLKYLGIDG